jgi:hypothetical protein
MDLIFRFVNIRDLSIFNDNISLKLSVCIDNSAASDENRVKSFIKSMELRSKSTLDEMVVECE